jgi:two-component system sensor histidine kinase YesM
MCEAYIEIQKMRKKHKIQFELEIDTAIRNYLIPKITLQPLIENAIIHGIDEKDGGTGCVAITGRMAGERIVLAVTDDGSGMSGDARQKRGDESAGSHYGLANIERRLSLFYGETITIEIKSTTGVGTRVSINLPLRRSADG